MRELDRGSTLCKDASFDAVPLGHPIMDRHIQGNATNGAVIKFSEAAQKGVARVISTANPKVFHVAFNSKNEWMLTLHHATNATNPERDRQHFLMFVKAAPDVPLPHCTYYWSFESNSIKPLDNDAKSR